MSTNKRIHYHQRVLSDATAQPTHSLVDYVEIKDLNNIDILQAGKTSRNIAYQFELDLNKNKDNKALTMTQSIESATYQTGKVINKSKESDFNGNPNIEKYKSKVKISSTTNSNQSNKMASPPSLGSIGINMVKKTIIKGMITSTTSSGGINNKKIIKHNSSSNNNTNNNSSSINNNTMLTPNIINLSDADCATSLSGKKSNNNMVSLSNMNKNLSFDSNPTLTGTTNYVATTIVSKTNPKIIDKLTEGFNSNSISSGKGGQSNSFNRGTTAKQTEKLKTESSIPQFSMSDSKKALELKESTGNLSNNKRNLIHISNDKPFLSIAGKENKSLEYIINSNKESKSHVTSNIKFRDKISVLGNGKASSTTPNIQVPISQHSQSNSTSAGPPTTNQNAALTTSAGSCGNYVQNIGTGFVKIKSSINPKYISTMQQNIRKKIEKKENSEFKYHNSLLSEKDNNYKDYLQFGLLNTSCNNAKETTIINKQILSTSTSNLNAPQAFRQMASSAQSKNEKLDEYGSIPKNHKEQIPVKPQPIRAIINLSSNVKDVISKKLAGNFSGTLYNSQPLNLTDAGVPIASQQKCNGDAMGKIIFKNSGLHSVVSNSINTSIEVGSYVNSRVSPTTKYNNLNESIVNQNELNVNKAGSAALNSKANSKLIKQKTQQLPSSGIQSGNISNNNSRPSSKMTNICFKPENKQPQAQAANQALSHRFSHQLNSNNQSNSNNTTINPCSNSLNPLGLNTKTQNLKEAKALFFAVVNNSSYPQQNNLIGKLGQLTQTQTQQNTSLIEGANPMNQATKKDDPSSSSKNNQNLSQQSSQNVSRIFSPTSPKINALSKTPILKHAISVISGPASTNATLINTHKKEVTTIVAQPQSSIAINNPVTSNNSSSRAQKLSSQETSRINSKTTKLLNDNHNTEGSYTKANHKSVISSSMSNISSAGVSLIYQQKPKGDMDTYNAGQSKNLLKKNILKREYREIPSPVPSDIQDFKEAAFEESSCLTISCCAELEKGFSSTIPKKEKNPNFLANKSISNKKLNINKKKSSGNNNSTFNSKASNQKDKYSMNFNCPSVPILLGTGNKQPVGLKHLATELGSANSSFLTKLNSINLGASHIKQKEVTKCFESNNQTMNESEADRTVLLETNPQFKMSSPPAEFHIIQEVKSATQQNGVRASSNSPTAININSFSLAQSTKRSNKKSQNQSLGGGNINLLKTHSNSIGEEDFMDINELNETENRNSSVVPVFSINRMSNYNGYMDNPNDISAEINRREKRFNTITSEVSKAMMMRGDASQDVSYRQSKTNITVIKDSKRQGSVFDITCASNNNTINTYSSKGNNLKALMINSNVQRINSKRLIQKLMSSHKPLSANHENGNLLLYILTVLNKEMMIASSFNSNKRMKKSSFHSEYGIINHNNLSSDSVFKMTKSSTNTRVKPSGKKSLLSSMFSYLQMKDVVNLSITSKHISKCLSPIILKMKLEYIHSRLRAYYNLVNKSSINISNFLNYRPQLWKSMISQSAYYRKSLNEKCTVQSLSKLCPTNTKSEIQKDLLRTIPDDPEFGKDKPFYFKLRDILQAYAVFNKKVGYAQGLNFIVANILYVFNNEEDAIIFFDLLLQKVNFTEILDINSNAVIRKMEILNDQIKKHEPSIYNYLDSLGLSHDFITTQWIFTLFASTISRDCLYAFWDFVILIGWDFFDCFIISIYQQFAGVILKLNPGSLSLSFREILKSKEFDKNLMSIINKAFMIYNSS